MSENEVQGQDEGIKLFGEWSFEGIEVRDIGLKRYLNVDPVYLPHTGGRHEARRFRKSNLSIVERLINNLLKPGKSGGAKGRVTNSMKTALTIINLKTGKNPIEVIVRAVENSAPNEDTTRIGYGGVVYRLAVDCSPQRRIDLALRYIALGIKAQTFGNRRTFEEIVADQLIGAANHDNNNFAIRRKQEVERIALSSR
ncbi:30S ribosomal protein S7 [Candidatus Bathyarchaeota archaeon]|jgi:small subunit ribosomal protein S7|nr:30S ribosomal protein S7 [Candidatus Bathyarchaeota archaeon]MBT4320854.1 30S ribosomal protein S7 [Candidatus Bathyarchaeota archaeon]MBT4423127.1 30S ribosomal protein S7 [Candidatus Bathyarchaeota archaeon]MBT6605504.1 30S ribosomal protein S7 [Candidatus Bathyarchaeota archaeon]MBT7347653.1 30S ribosomal protein S7 [Candidatus Bathyarchaeota archaeon]